MPSTTRPAEKQEQTGVLRRMTTPLLFNTTERRSLMPTVQFFKYEVKKKSERVAWEEKHVSIPGQNYKKAAIMFMCIHVMLTPVYRLVDSFANDAK